MFKLIGKIIILAVSVAIIALYTVPTYKKIQALNVDVKRYEQTLADSKELLDLRKKLSEKYGTITPEQLERINKLLPDNVDNIRLILEIDDVSKKYGMVIKNVKFDSANQKTDAKSSLADQSNAQALEQNKDYGKFTFEFSTAGNYANFVSFVSDIEKSLRIVDVSSIKFSTPDSVAAVAAGINPGKPKDINNYDYKINTYWLKN
mgnify:CR=1 FL=1